MPLVPLPSVLKEDFNENLKPETWPEVYGAERGTLSGEPLKSGTALIFKGVSIPDGPAVFKRWRIIKPFCKMVLSSL